MAQELLWTFGEAVGEVALIPGQDGIFEIHVGNHPVWSRQADGGFPDLKELKQRLRDQVLPHIALGQLRNRFSFRGKTFDGRCYKK